MQELIQMYLLLLKMATEMRLGVNISSVIKSSVFKDNIWALATAKTVKTTPLTKHINFKYHFFNPHCGEGSGITLVNFDTLIQKAGIFQ